MISCCRRDSLPAEECSYMSSRISQIRPTKISEGFPISFLSAYSTFTGHCLFGQVLLTCGSNIISLPSSIWHHHHPHQGIPLQRGEGCICFTVFREVSRTGKPGCCVHGLVKSDKDWERWTTTTERSPSVQFLVPQCLKELLEKMILWIFFFMKRFEE